MDHTLSQKKQQWLAKQCLVSDIFPLAGDASFRQYFRVISGEDSFILMDAQKEPSVYQAALNASAYWFENNLPVPKVIAHDDALCCILIDDFGDDLYSTVLSQQNHYALYKKAIDVLLKLYTLKPKAFGAYQALDESLIDFECQGFCQYYLEGLLGHALDAAQKKILDNAFKFISQQVRAQPFVFIHRDYHCRNILVRQSAPLTTEPANNNPAEVAFGKHSIRPLAKCASVRKVGDGLEHRTGVYKCIHEDSSTEPANKFSAEVALCKRPIGVIDFQDAMCGPVTYDLASLLRDCYIQWPKENVLALVNYFYSKAVGLEIINDVDEKTFLAWFNITSIERHLKAIFTFSRKALRDNDESFLKHIKPTLSYVFDSAAHFDELHDFRQLLKKLIEEKK
jgi:N-acetylmuramate 1-kinase